MSACDITSLYPTTSDYKQQVKETSNIDDLIDGIDIKDKCLIEKIFFELITVK